MSLSLKNCKILVGEKWTTTNIFIDNSIIQHIGQFREADDILDVKNKVVMPGLIDSHVHFRDPGFTNKEDFFSGSCSAAAGGVTTVLDMPNTMPTTTTRKALEEKRQRAVKSLVNYGFHFGAMENNLAEIKKVNNIASVKVYMNETTGNLKLDTTSNHAFLKKVFNSFKRIAVHAERQQVKEALERTKKNELYVCHVPGKQELDFIQKYRGKKTVFTEVTPHHLFLTKDDEKELGGFGIMKPRLGTKTDQRALWQALGRGEVNTIATDHAPHTIEEKNAKKPPYGVPGLETILPLLLNAVNEKKLTLQKVQELCCENPAKIFGIENKGSIAVGYDADLAVIDLDLVKPVQNETLFTKCKWSPFNGWHLKGWPITTIVQGNIIYQDGDIFAQCGGKEVQFSEP